MTDSGEDCGRWRNGRLVPDCLSAGTEYCMFECPFSKRHSRDNTDQSLEAACSNRISMEASIAARIELETEA
jgi:hypothetical protein